MYVYVPAVFGVNVILPFGFPQVGCTTVEFIPNTTGVTQVPPLQFVAPVELFIEGGTSFVQVPPSGIRLKVLPAGEGLGPAYCKTPGKIAFIC